mmetsp:Transcript_2612/g.3857  ORF Transcript_2612/g.3857 Transcript_2612/m.3857 type:complete len:84 (-) Transcript_2612:459-710(-)|eukprot:scaffold117586_cov33-Tisochrysis_lutea.AAC.1
MCAVLSKVDGLRTFTKKLYLLLRCVGLSRSHNSLTLAQKRVRLLAWSYLFQRFSTTRPRCALDHVDGMRDAATIHCRTWHHRD